MKLLCARRIGRLEIGAVGHGHERLQWIGGLQAALLLGLCLALHSAASADVLTGHVVGPDGRAVAGAAVDTYPYTRFSDSARSLKTDSSGAFSIESTTSANGESYALVVVYAPGFGVAASTLTKTGDNTIHLDKAKDLHGTLVDEKGTPLVGVLVHLRSLFLGGSPSSGGAYIWIPDSLSDFTVKTGPGGAWTFHGLTQKAVTGSVVLMDPNYVKDAIEVPCDPTAPPKPLVAHPGAILAGRVVGGDGKPRAGVKIESREESFGRAFAEATTAADGSYQLAGLPSAMVAVWISNRSESGGSDVMPSEVAAPLRHIRVNAGKKMDAPDLVLGPGGLIAGTVTDAVTGKPIDVSHVPLYARESSSDRSIPGGSVLPDASGHFTIRVPAGSQSIAFQQSPKGYLLDPDNPWGEGSITVKVVEGQTQSVDLRLARALTLSGITLDEAGKPVAGVQIVVMEQGAPPAATTDSDGRWTLDNLKPGSVRIVGKNDFEVISGNEIKLPTAAPAKLIVRPFHAAPVTAKVMAADGKPIAGANVQALVKMAMAGAAWMDVKQFTTDSKGEFTIPDLRPENSEVRLTVSKAGYKLVSVGAVKHQPDRLTITDTILQSLESNRKLTGRVLTADGKPAHYALVVAPTAEPGTGRARTDAAGGFLLTGVPEAEDTVFAAYGSDFGRASAEKSVVSLVPAAVKTAERDTVRAQALLESLAREYPSDKDWAARGAIYEIAPLAPELALKLARPERGGGTVLEDWKLAALIEAVVARRPDRIKDWALPLLQTIGDLEQHRNTMYAVAVASGSTNPPLLSAAYAELVASAAPTTGSLGISNFAKRSVIAFRLGRVDEARANLDKAIALVKASGEKPDFGTILDLARTIAAADPSLVRLVLPLAPTEYRSQVYMEVIQAVARYSGIGARDLWDDMTADGSTDAFTRSRAAAVVVRALGKTDPTAAAKVAEGGTGYQNFQGFALALAAQSQSSRVRAAELYQQSIAALRFDPGQVARIAAMAYETDPDLGRTIFAQAKQSIEDAAEKNPDNYASELASFAYYYARIAPGESRLMLEAAYSREQAETFAGRDETGQARADLALAMRVLDVNRALAFCELIPDHQKDNDYNPRAATKVALAKYMLATEAQRRAEPLNPSNNDWGVDSE